MSSVTERLVGWIGVGKMGAPMARHLAAAGVSLQVFDMRPASYVDLLGDKVVAANSIQLVGASCDIVFSSIPDDAVLLSLVEGETGDKGLAASMPSGSILVETSTVSPEASQRVASQLEAKGIGYVRAPVSGSTALAQTAGLTVLASGPRAHYDAVEPLLALFSKRRFWLGNGDGARYMKLVLNTMVGATASILGESLRLGEHGGLSRKDMMEVILESAVTSPLLEYKKGTIVGTDPETAFRLDQMVKDFSLIVAAARRENIELDVANLILEQYQQAAQNGRAGEDFFALIDWIAEASPQAR